MVTAVILINAERGCVGRVAEELAALPSISEVYSVGGSYDLVAIARVRENEELAHLVTDAIQKVEGIARTQTLLAFKAYSRHDLEGIFSAGME